MWIFAMIAGSNKFIDRRQLSFGVYILTDMIISDPAVTLVGDDRDRVLIVNPYQGSVTVPLLQLLGTVADSPDGFLAGMHVAQFNDDLEFETVVELVVVGDTLLCSPFDTNYYVEVPFATVVAFVERDLPPPIVWFIRFVDEMVVKGWFGAADSPDGRRYWATEAGVQHFGLCNVTVH
jgi:hypothetical protein